MSILGFSPVEARKLLETAFEPHGSGFAYFRDRWSPGVPVSAEEREVYVSRWYLGSTAAFHKKIAGRAPVAPPRGGRAVGRVMRAIPLKFGIILFGGGLLAAVMGSFADSELERWLTWGVAVLAFVVGMAWLVLQRAPRDAP
jgi:hypothetical protein